MGAWTAKRIGLVAGPALALSLQLLPTPDGLGPSAWQVASLMALMAVWWATEAIPIPATSLLPLVALPLIEAGPAIDAALAAAPVDASDVDKVELAAGAARRTAGQAARGYSSPIVLLLLGGFIIAMGIERWGLHRRIALNVVAAVGSSQNRLVLGFMAATALLSMWISNTATTLMMTPIALSAASALRDGSGRFAAALLLGVCYAASIGGAGTPIGTPTNLIAIQWLETNANATIGFPQWMAYGVPAVLLLVPAAWWSVTRGLAPLEDANAAVASVREERAALPPMSAQEARAAMVFGVVALLWISRVFVQNTAQAAGIAPPWLLGVSDMGIAIAGGVAMFLVPAAKGAGRSLLTWDEAVKLPWGVLILFGGGISLGQAVTRTGLSKWLGDQLAALSVLPPIFFIAAVVALVIFLTELTSNVATMTTLAPVLGALSGAIGAAPESLLAPAAVAASCAFMLPVATAPNAIVYATNQVAISQMMRTGLRVNLIGVVVIAAIGFWIAPRVL